MDPHCTMGCTGSSINNNNNNNSAVYKNGNIDIDKFIYGVISICETFDIQNEKFNEIIKDYHTYRIKLLQPKINDHYTFCVWSNPQTVSGSDTCKCHRMEWLPKFFVDSIVNAVGLEIILSCISLK